MTPINPLALKAAHHAIFDAEPCEMSAYEMSGYLAKLALAAYHDWLESQGLVIVPKKPTEDMVFAAHSHHEYEAMISAYEKAQFEKAQFEKAQFEKAKVTKTSLKQRSATYTCDETEYGNLYYFSPGGRRPAPYHRQIEIRAIVDVADDGTLAGVEIIDPLVPPPPVMSTNGAAP